MDRRLALLDCVLQVLEDSLDVVLQFGDDFFGLALGVAFAERWEPLHVLLCDFLVDFVFETCEVSWTLESQAV